MSNKYTPLQQLNTVHMNLIGGFSKYITEITSGREVSAASWHFIPAYTMYNIEAFQDLRDYFERKRISIKKQKFLDCGCGIGNVMLTYMRIMEIGDENIYGIDHNQEALIIANSAFGFTNLIHQDLFKFEKYDEFDVIYFYQPFHNYNLQWEFEDHVISKVKPGTVIISH